MDLAASGDGIDDEWPDESGDRNFPLILPLQYRVCEVEAGGAEEAARDGSGRTLKISRRAVQFESEETLRAGLKVELFIAWPVTLNKSAGLTLRIKGHIVRTSQNRAELKTESYEFRTRLYKRAC